MNVITLVAGKQSMQKQLDGTWEEFEDKPKTIAPVYMCWPVGSNNNPGSLLVVSPTAIDLRTSCELVLQL